MKVITVLRTVNRMESMETVNRMKNIMMDRPCSFVDFNFTCRLTSPSERSRWVSFEASPCPVLQKEEALIVLHLVVALKGRDCINNDISFSRLRASNDEYKVRETDNHLMLSSVSLVLFEDPRTNL